MKMTTSDMREPILRTALPSIISGLAGIPVGLSLQNVFHTIAEAGRASASDSPPSVQLSHAGWYLLFLVGFYVVYCGVLLLTLEAGSQHTANDSGRDGEWDRFIAFMSVYHVPCAVCLVGALVAAGVTYDPADLSLSGVWVLLSATVLSFSYFPAFFQRRVRQALLSRYRLLTGLAMLGTVVLAATLYWGVLRLFSA
jgi:hypothetical protein